MDKRLLSGPKAEYPITGLRFPEAVRGLSPGCGVDSVPQRRRNGLNTPEDQRHARRLHREALTYQPVHSLRYRSSPSTAPSTKKSRSTALSLHGRWLSPRRIIQSLQRAPSVCKHNLGCGRKSAVCSLREVSRLRLRPSRQLHPRLPRMRLAARGSAVECHRETPPVHACDVPAPRRGAQRRRGVGVCDVVCAQICIQALGWPANRGRPALVAASGASGGRPKGHGAVAKAWFRL